MNYVNDEVIVIFVVFALKIFLSRSNLIAKAFALKCWNYTSTQAGCGDPFDKTKVKTLPCTGGDQICLKIISE